MGENARKGKHERTKSKELFSRRMTNEGRKAMSAEPPTAAWVQGKRWEDLIEAATSATEADDDRDLTPVSQTTFFDCPSVYLLLSRDRDFVEDVLLFGEAQMSKQNITVLISSARWRETASDNTYYKRWHTVTGANHWR